MSSRTQQTQETTRPVGDGSDWALRNCLALLQGVEFAAWRSPDGRAFVDLLWVPETMRRRGVGRRIYHVWESGLPAGTEVSLFSIDDEAAAFWRALGFRGSDNGPMTKTVNRLALAA